MIAQYPVIAITGPRQSGKTTLLKNMFPDYRYISLENPESREFAQKDPKGFLTQYSEKVIFDEAQNVPTLFSYIQGIVDEKQQMGQFVLSGSQNFQLMERITQSLAGRVAIFKLFPFENSEMSSAHWLSNDLSEAMTMGFYPAIFERKTNQDNYYANYLDTYINRDVSQLVNIQDARTFKNFVKLCATRAANILNISDLARDAGVSHTTARNWLSILETSYVIYLLPPFHRNYGKRLVKSPKLYFYDTGLLSHLLGIRKKKLSKTDGFWGALFENMAVSELIKQNAHQGLHRDYYYWRDSKGHELDLLYNENQELYLYEIKASSTIQTKFFAGLDHFSKIAKDEKVAAKNLIYGGDESQKRTDYNVLKWNDLH
jgi:predicted AAA+ superfamily ATPase